MPRNITVTFSDGSTHVYRNAPDTVTPEQVSQRAQQDFGKQVKALDGGRKAAAPRQPAPRQSIGTTALNSLAAVGGSLFRGAAALPDMLADGGEAVNNGIQNALAAGLSMFGAEKAAQFVAPKPNQRRFRLGDVPDRMGTPRPVAPGVEMTGNIMGSMVVPGPPTPPVKPGFPVPTTASKASARVARRQERAAVMAAADRQGVTMLPADVGGTGTRMASGVVGRTLGGIPMAEAADKAIKSAGAARDRVASAVGLIADETGAGQAAQRGAKAFVSQSEKRGGDLFERISIRPEAKASLENTRSALAEITRGMKSNPELSAIWTGNPRLKASLEALTPKDTRQAGQVMLSAADDQVRAAERAVAQSQDEAARALEFERQQATGALDRATSDFSSAAKAAQEAAEQAKSRYEMIRNQVVPSEALIAARQEVDRAQSLSAAFANRDLAVPEVKQFASAIDEATANLNSLRFREPTSDAVKQANDALAGVRSARDKAFIEANQPPIGGELSWADMKRLRTIVGEIIGQPGLSADGNAISAMRRFYGALSKDMEATASATGHRALTEFRRANQYWSGRQARIDNVLSGILGPDMNKGEAAAFEQINRWAQTRGGDFKRLSQAMRSMPAEEADTVRASLLSRMGQASPARQNPDGLQFSPAEFATQWQRLDRRARSVLFPNGEHRAAINDLVQVMDSMKRAGQFANFSNTSLGTNALGVSLSALSGPAGLFTAAAYSGGTFGIGKLLSSPSFARWLARTPKTSNPAVLGSYVGKLPAIAVTSSPAVKEEIGNLIRLFANDVGVPAAASDGQENQGEQQPPLQP